MIELNDRLYDAIQNEAERLKAEGVPPDKAWLQAVETEYRKAQAHKGAALVERAIWDRHMRGRREA